MNSSSLDIFTKLDPILECFENVDCNILLIHKGSGFPNIKRHCSLRNKGDSREVTVYCQKYNITITLKNIINK